MKKINKHKKLNLATLLFFNLTLFGGAMISSQSFANQDPPATQPNLEEIIKKLDNLEGRYNETIGDHHVKENYEAGRNTVKYDRYFNGKDTPSVVRDKITLGTNLIEITDSTEPYYGERAFDFPDYLNKDKFKNETESANNKKTDFRLNAENHVGRNLYKAYSKLSNKSLNQFLDTIKANESTIKTKMDRTNVNNGIRTSRANLTESSFILSGLSSIVPFVMEGELNEFGKQNADITLLDLYKNIDNSYNDFASKLGNIFNEDGSLKVSSIEDAKRELIKIRNEDRAKNDLFISTSLMKESETPENKTSAYESIENITKESVSRIRGLDNDGLEKLKNLYLRKIEHKEPISLLGAASIENLLDNVDVSEESLRERYKDNDRLYKEAVKKSEKYLSIKDPKLRKETLKADIMEVLNKKIPLFSTHTTPGANSGKYDIYVKEVEKLKEEFADKFEFIDMGGASFEDYVGDSGFLMNPTSFAGFFYDKDISIKEAKDKLNKEIAFYKELKDATTKEEKMNVLKKPENVDFYLKYNEDSSKIDEEMARAKGKLDFYKMFDGIEGVENLTEKEFLSFFSANYPREENKSMDSIHNLDFLRGVTIDNVKDGEISENSKQAVNGGQIYRLKKELDDKIMNKVNNNTQRIEQVEKRLDQTTKEMRAGIAGAYALNGISQASLPGQSAIGVGVGNFKGASALAIGISKKTENGKVSFKLGGSVNTNKDVGVSGGVTYFF